MLLMTFRFIRSVYPVLKESLLGKQSLIDAAKTSKIKVLSLAYCVLSPFAISYLSNKTVSLAATNIALTKQISAMTIVLENIPVPPIVAATPVLPVPMATISPVPLSPASSVQAPPIPRKPSQRHTRHLPTTPVPRETPTVNYEELINRNHEHY